MIRMRMRLQCLSIVMLAGVVVGCGGGPDYKLGSVEGTVTLDEKPLADAELRFQPPQGRSSVAVTDQNGHYVLDYTTEQKGAELGTHSVSITTLRSASGGEGEQPAVPGRDELLPARYHAKTELTADVKQGSNTIDFHLKSK
jgi:hypothetical protein